MAPDQRYEAWFRANGINYRYLPDVQLSRIDKQAGLRNQARLTEVLDDDLVLRYSLAMEAGAQFPPLTVHDTGVRFVPIDGNHTLAACDLAGRTSHDVYIVDEADSYTIAWMTRLMNSAVGGKTPSPEENLRQAVQLVMQFNKSAVEIATRAHLKPRLVEQAVRRQRAADRIESLGLSTKKMPASVIDDTPAIKQDRPLVEALKLRESVRLPHGLWQELVRNINAKSNSEQAMVQAVADFAQDPRVKQSRVESASGRVRPSVQVRNGFTTRLTSLAKFVNEHPTPEALQLTSRLYLDETMTVWRGLNKSMEEVFTNARKALTTGPTAHVPAGGARRR